jgi:signal recognition particle subunit SEC65
MADQDLGRKRYDPVAGNMRHRRQGEVGWGRSPDVRAPSGRIGQHEISEAVAALQVAVPRDENIHEIVEDAGREEVAEEDEMKPKKGKDNEDGDIRGGFVAAEKKEKETKLVDRPHSDNNQEDEFEQA